MLKREKIVVGNFRKGLMGISTIGVVSVLSVTVFTSIDLTGLFFLLSFFFANLFISGFILYKILAFYERKNMILKKPFFVGLFTSVMINLLLLQLYEFSDQLINK
jgi:hypothetical protein